MICASRGESKREPSSRRRFFGAAALGLLTSVAGKALAAFESHRAADVADDPPMWKNDHRYLAGAPTVTYTYDELARVVAMVDTTPPRRRTIEYGP